MLNSTPHVRTQPSVVRFSCTVLKPFLNQIINQTGNYLLSIDLVKHFLKFMFLKIGSFLVNYSLEQGFDTLFELTPTLFLLFLPWISSLSSGAHRGRLVLSSAATLSHCSRLVQYTMIEPSSANLLPEDYNMQASWPELEKRSHDSKQAKCII